MNAILLVEMQELRNNSVSLSHLHSWPCRRPDSFAHYETELSCLVAAAQGGFRARMTFFKSCFGQETLAHVLGNTEQAFTS